MKLILCYCPVADPALPPPGLAALGAQLSQNELCNYDLVDLNLNIFLYLFTKEKIGNAIKNVTKRILGKDFISVEADQEARILIEKAKDLPERIEKVIEDFRKPEFFYNNLSYLKMHDDFFLACRLLSLQYDDIRFGKYSLYENGFDGYEEIKKQIDSKSSSFVADFYKNTILKKIETDRPDIVGISVAYFSQLIPSFILANEIRNVRPEIHLTFGGPVINWGKSLFINQAEKFSKLMDSFCIGEGELCLSGLVKAMEKGEKLHSVPNLIFFENGKLIENPSATKDVNMSNLETPDYSGLFLERYIAPERIISLPLTKGCYYNKCMFCNYSFIKITTYRERPIDLTIKDLKEIVRRTGENVFSFESDVINPRYLFDLSKAIIDSNLKIKWHACMRFEEDLPEQFFEIISKAGCVRMYLGLESGNQRVLNKMVKGIKIEVIENILRYLHEFGIAVEVGIILGYPGETIEEASNTIDLIKRNYNKITRPDIGFFRLLKGAPIEKELNEYDLCVLGEKEKIWYEVKILDKYFEANKSKYMDLIHEINKMYPSLSFLDVSEEILYTAKYGSGIIRDFTKDQICSINHI